MSDLTQGSVVATDGSGVKDGEVTLHFFGDKVVGETKGFMCEPVENGGLKICQVKTDVNGKFSFANIMFGKYKLSAEIVKDGIRFDMAPELITADLSRHKDLFLQDKFVLSKVSLLSQAFLSENVRLT